MVGVVRSVARTLTASSEDDAKDATKAHKQVQADSLKSVEMMCKIEAQEHINRKTCMQKEC